MQVITTAAQLHEHIQSLKDEGKCVGFVPTMGALHAGHLSLVQLAQQHTDNVVVSIFVNPTQFSEGEDLDRYPRQEEQDLAACEAAGVDVVYLPGVAELYPEGKVSDITPPKELTELLCGLYRPGHFAGVATVVKRLLEQVAPDVAVFGEKDYQQLQVIRWLVEEYTIPVDIIGAPILREADGLAMSSRNAYLNEEQRAIAPELHHILQKIADGHGLQDAKHALEEAGFSIDYVEIHNGRVYAAAHLGNVRLIDNLPISK